MLYSTEAHHTSRGEFTATWPGVEEGAGASRAEELQTSARRRPSIGAATARARQPRTDVQIDGCDRAPGLGSQVEEDRASIQPVIERAAAPRPWYRRPRRRSARAGSPGSGPDRSIAEEGRRCARIDVAAVIVEPERQLDAAGPDAEPILPMIIHRIPIERCR